MLHTKNTLIKINLKSVIYIETDRRDLIIHEEDKSYRVKMSMKNMEMILEGGKDSTDVILVISST